MSLRSRISHAGSSLHLGFRVSPGKMSLLILKLSASSTSDSFVPFGLNSLDSLKIQSWCLTSWNAEENPNCHGPSVSSAGISCIFLSDWLLECGRDLGLIHPFHLFLLTMFMPCPLSIPDCLFVEQLSEESARGAKIPSSHSSWSHFSLHCILFSLSYLAFP